MTDKQDAAWKKFSEYSKKNAKILKKEDETTKYTITINSAQRDLLDGLLRDETHHQSALFGAEIREDEPDAYTMSLLDLYEERAAKLLRLIKHAEPVQD